MKMQISRDSEGYLINPEDWDEKIARQLAAEEDIELDETYWPVLMFIRSYYDEHAIAPDVRHVIKHIAKQNNYDKKEAKDFIFNLFPFGYVKQACKISGMKRPRAWSTG
jgi:TusE/DsrC/DsvC family sulfur relay protein